MKLIGIVATMLSTIILNRSPFAGELQADSPPLDLGVFVASAGSPGRFRRVAEAPDTLSQFAAIILPFAGRDNAKNGELEDCLFKAA